MFWSPIYPIPFGIATRSYIMHLQQCGICQRLDNVPTCQHGGIISQPMCDPSMPFHGGQYPSARYPWSRYPCLCTIPCIWVTMVLWHLTLCSNTVWGGYMVGVEVRSLQGHSETLTVLLGLRMTSGSVAKESTRQFAKWPVEAEAQRILFALFEEPNEMVGICTHTWCL